MRPFMMGHSITKLVVSTPLKTMKVSWDDSSQYLYSIWKNKHVPNHQPETLLWFIIQAHGFFGWFPYETPSMVMTCAPRVTSDLMVCRIQNVADNASLSGRRFGPLQQISLWGHVCTIECSLSTAGLQSCTNAPFASHVLILYINAPDTDDTVGCIYSHP